MRAAGRLASVLVRMAWRPWEHVASARARRAISIARFASAAGPAATIVLSTASTPSARIAAWATAAYATARVACNRDGRVPCLLDATVASIAINATGSLSSPLLPFGAAVAVAAGLGGGLGAGAFAGIVVTAASVPDLATESGAGFAAWNHVLTWAALFPMAGLVSALGGRVWTTPSPARVAQIERRRIAHDLHDGVAQTLAHLRLELDMLSRPEFAPMSDPEEIARLARIAERTLADVRSIIQELTPPPPPGGLSVALASYIADLDTGRGPRIELRTLGEIPPGHHASAHLYRIAQEAISNALRHSGASKVSVLVERSTGGSLRLTVQDNGSGVGAASAGSATGVGLTAMRERALALGGTCSISPAPGGGTRVRVDTPASLMRIA